MQDNQIKKRKEKVSYFVLFAIIPYIYNKIQYNMRKLTTSKKSGKKKFFIDGVECTQNEFQQAYAKNKGYKNFYQLGRKKGYKWPNIKTRPEQTFRIKEEYNNKPDGIKEIPNIPNYYATEEGQIWCWSNRRNCWINIAQQTQKSLYKVFQPYINGKRCVRYSHIAIHNAFHGLCPANHEIHHIDRDNTNNHASNLMCMPKDDHRRLKRGKYKK